MNDSQKMKWYTLAFMYFFNSMGFWKRIKRIYVLQRNSSYLFLDFDVCVVLRSLCINGR